jgi:hypothetical protein
VSNSQVPNVMIFHCEESFDFTQSLPELAEGVDSTLKQLDRRYHFSKFKISPFGRNDRTLFVFPISLLSFRTNARNLSRLAFNDSVTMFEFLGSYLSGAMADD